jgi:hypothetical protein
MVPASTSNDGAPEIPGRAQPVGRRRRAGQRRGGAHVLDYDDVGMEGHPSAAIPHGDPRRGLDARRRAREEALAAYVAGYEVWALVAGARARRAARARLPSDRDLGNVSAAGGLRRASIRLDT